MFGRISYAWRNSLARSKNSKWSIGEAIIGHQPTVQGGDTSTLSHFREFSDLTVPWERACRHLLDEKWQASSLTLVTQRPCPIWIHLTVAWVLLAANNHPAEQGQGIRRQHHRSQHWLDGGTDDPARLGQW